MYIGQAPCIYAAFSYPGKYLACDEIPQNFKTRKAETLSKFIKVKENNDLAIQVLL